MALVAGFVGSRGTVKVDVELGRTKARKDRTRLVMTI